MKLTNKEAIQYYLANMNNPIEPNLIIDWLKKILATQIKNE